MALPGSPPASPAPKPIAAKPAKGKVVPPKKKAIAVAAAPANPFQQQAQSEIDPIIAAITAAAQGQAQAADQAIQGLTNSYAKGIAGIDYGAPYSSGEAQQAAVDAALQQAATGQGSDLAAALSQRLQALQGSSGANAVNQEAAALANQGAGIGGAQLATGSAALNQLISDAAAAKEYGAKMPGVIDSAGIQNVGNVQNQAQQQISQGTLQAEAQLPQIEQSLKADKLQAQADAVTKAYKQAELALSGQRNQISAQRAAVSAQQGAARLAQGQARLGLEQQRIGIEAQRAANSSKATWARIGIEDKRLQISAMKSSIAAKNGGLSANEVSRYNSIADSWAQRMTGTTTDPNTMVKGPNGNLIPKTLPQLSFKDAMTQALKAGVPLSIAFPQFIKVAKQSGATPQQIRQLQKEYKPLDNAIKVAAKKALVTPQNAFSGLSAIPTTVPKGGMGASGKYSNYQSSTSHAGGFLPAGMGFSYDRHDQGRDIQTKPGAPIIAPGDGYVVRIASDPGGGGGHFGPSYPIVHFTSGPYAGKDVYIGHTVAAVRPGQKFRAGMVLSRTQQSGPMNGGAPSGWAEIGFAPGATPGPNGQVAPF